MGNRRGEHDCDAPATRRAACAARGRARARSSRARARARACGLRRDAGRQDAADEVDRSAISGVSAEMIESRPARVAAQASRTGSPGDAHPHGSPLLYGSSWSRMRRSSSSLPGSRIASTWSPASIWVSSSGTSALPSRTTEIRRAPSGSWSARTRLPLQFASLSIVTSTISRFSFRSSSRWIRPCSGTSCSISAMIDAVAETVGEMPRRSKYGWLRGSLMRAITLLDAVLLAGELADDHVVLVVAGRSDEQVGRPLDPGALEHEQFGGVATQHLVLELGLELVEAVRALLDQRHLVTAAQERACEVRADLAAARDEDVHQRASTGSVERTAPTSASIATRSGRRCAAPATHRTARGPGRAHGR